jgi:hypothetical protein
VVQFSRGCPFSCTFCLGARQLGHKYRTREPQSVLADLTKLHQLTEFPYGMFHDNDVAHPPRGDQAAPARDDRRQGQAQPP